MSEREPATKDYVDRIGSFLFAAIVILLLLTTFTDACQNKKIRDLQRRVGQLEGQSARYVVEAVAALDDESAAITLKFAICNVVLDLN